MKVVQTFYNYLKASIGHLPEYIVKTVLEHIMWIFIYGLCSWALGKKENRVIFAF
jgi:hypothetical protein